MNIRKGFVSNSSSSSFILTTKNGKTLEDNKDILREVLKKAINAEELMNQLVDCIINNSDKYENIQDYLDEHCITKIEDIWDKERGIVKFAAENENASLYSGSVASDGETLEQFLVDVDINYEDEHIKIYKDGSY